MRFWDKIKRAFRSDKTSQEPVRISFKTPADAPMPPPELAEQKEGYSSKGFLFFQKYFSVVIDNNTATITPAEHTKDHTKLLDFLQKIFDSAVFTASISSAPPELIITKKEDAPAKPVLDDIAHICRVIARNTQKDYQALDKLLLDGNAAQNASRDFGLNDTSKDSRLR